MKMTSFFFGKNLRLQIFSFAFFLAPLVHAQEVNVDPLTGSPNITVPIYTLNYGSLKVPVSLVYSSPGLAVREGEGDAGFGWNLSCNYGVFREVRGLPDTGSGAANANALAYNADDNLTTYTDEAADYATLSGWGSTADSQPDVFTASGPGLYVQFVFDASGTPRLLNYQDVVVTYDNSYRNFTIKNNRGWTYSFTTKMDVTRKTYLKGAVTDMFTTDMNYYMPLGGTNFISAWYLTSVTDEKGNAVSFTYAASMNSEYAVDWKTRITSAGVQDTLYYLADSYFPLHLSTITAGNYKVDFFGYTRPLHDITVSESSMGDLFNFRFAYQLVKSSSDVNQPLVAHQFLTQLMPFNACVPQTPYKFSYQGVDLLTNPNSYYPVDMPWKKLLNQDMWGYYNGVSSNNNVPQVYYYQFQTDSRRFSVQALPGWTPTSTLTGADRNTSAAKVGNGTLTKITYPTGGTAQIIWERNKYFDSSAGSGKVFYGPGLRVATIISDGGEAAFAKTSTSSNTYHQIRKDYVYVKSDTDTTTSGLILYPPAYGFATGSRMIRTHTNSYPQNVLYYSRVKEKVSGQGARVYEYALPAMYPATSYNNEWFVPKSKIARNQSTHQVLNGDVQNGYYTFPFAPSPNYDFERGLLTRQSEFAETGSWVRDKKYEYVRQAPALQNVYGVKFEYLSATDCDCFHYAKYAHITGTTKVISKITEREISETNTQDTAKVITVYHYNTDYVNNNFLMDSIRTVYGDGSVKRQKFRYIKDFASLTNPATTDVMANAIKTMVTANRHGELVEQYTTYQPVGGVPAMAGASLRLFKDFGNGKPYLYQTYALPPVTSFTPASIVSGATQTFVFDQADYLLSSTISEYDGMGNAVSVSDNKKNKVAYHYAQNYTLGPVASFANAAASETIYEGFEFVTGRGFNNVTHGSSGTSGYTGTTYGGVYLTPIYSSNLSNTGKPYRVSCRVNGAQAATLTFALVNPANGNSTVASVNLSYTTPNQWTYLEGVVNPGTTTPATLAVALSSSQSVSLDDILVLPADATVTTATYLPLKGVTSQTDDRGNAAWVAYDALGRKIQTYDRQRNLAEVYEYQFNGQVAVPVAAVFSVPDMMAGTTQVVNANTTVNCFGSASYSWQLDGVDYGSTSSVNLYGSIPGSHNLKLRVMNTLTGEYAETAQNFCVTVPLPNTPPSFSFTCNAPVNAQGKYVDYQCGNGVNFTVSGVDGACSNATKQYTWSLSTDGSTFLTSAMSAYTTNIAYVKGASQYWVKVRVTTTCNSNDPKCPGTTTNYSEQIIYVTYVNNGPCQ
jgi:hypothetical protein